MTEKQDRFVRPPSSLEHEFGKVRAYKSIRQLASGEPGAVVAAMRPVWLMSPSSLSDTLPLEASFDVVIFDEASQIPIEEAVPALYRAEQVIVVGDQMQLPPTQYFQARQNDAEGPTDDDAASTVGVVLEADSFLAVSSARLPSTMLLWHYRSRYEALIQFSNAAFYEGRLATIPDRSVSVRSGSLEVSSGEQIDPADVRGVVDGVLERSISMIRVRGGIYVQRTNPTEATWIAELVRELLLRESGQTFGVVAFSEAQQSEIERALERLSTADPDFATRYEAELAREDDGQGVGLFVKNLENVQGDERDVIIMSVCYAPGPDSRTRMNFGPINTAGGEKRLNVIFSRARQHMVLVSTIDHTAITNTYNDGANTLKNFLRYAAAISEGDDDAAANLLAGLRERRTVASAGGLRAALADQLAQFLEQRGLEVARDVGQSDFRCDLAVRVPGAGGFTDAVLIDHAARLDHGALDERRLVQPGALATAGWRVHHVLATEWLDHPNLVVDRLVESARSS